MVDLSKAKAGDRVLVEFTFDGFDRNAGRTVKLTCGKGLQSQVIHVEPEYIKNLDPVFDWSTAKVGMAFDCAPKTGGNEYWWFIYSGVCPLTGRKLFACQSKGDGRKVSANETSDDMIEAMRRAPEHDVEVSA